MLRLILLFPDLESKRNDFLNLGNESDDVIVKLAFLLRRSKIEVIHFLKRCPWNIGLEKEECQNGIQIED